MIIPILAEWQFTSEIDKTTYKIRIQNHYNDLKSVEFYDAWEMEGATQWSILSRSLNSFLEKPHWKCFSIPQDVIEFAKVKGYKNFL